MIYIQGVPKRFDSFLGKLFIGLLISLDFLNNVRGIQRQYKYTSMNYNKMKNKMATIIFIVLS